MPRHKFGSGILNPRHAYQRTKTGKVSVSQKKEKKRKRTQSTEECSQSNMTRIDNVDNNNNDIYNDINNDIEENDKYFNNDIVDNGQRINELQELRHLRNNVAIEWKVDH